MMMIQLIDIEKHYRFGSNNIHVLQKICLSVESNEFICIMGPSGSGKSTLLHIIGCLDRPSSGTYLLDGKNITNASDSELSKIRNSFGFVFQNFNLIPSLNVYENIEVPFLYRPFDSSYKTRIHQTLEQVGLIDRRYHLPSELSGGELQRVAIARALVIQPKIIIADEPTGNLDSKTSDEILKLFQMVYQQGTAIIVVTHDTHVASFANKILNIKDGKLFDTSI